MIERPLCLVRKTTESDEELIKEHMNKNIFYDGVWYKVVNCTIEDRIKGESKKIHLSLNSLEGKEYIEKVTEELEKKKKEILNIPAYIYDLNERYIDIIGIIPLQLGEQFKDYLISELEVYNGVDCITYPENLEDKIEFDEDNEEWDFNNYRWLIWTREQTPYGYSERFYALKDLNNLNLVNKEEDE